MGKPPARPLTRVVRVGGESYPPPLMFSYSHNSPMMTPLEAAQRFGGAHIEQTRQSLLAQVQKRASEMKKTAGLSSNEKERAAQKFRARVQDTMYRRQGGDYENHADDDDEEDDIANDVDAFMRPGSSWREGGRSSSSSRGAGCSGQQQPYTGAHYSYDDYEYGAPMSGRYDDEDYDSEDDDDDALNMGGVAKKKKKIPKSMVRNPKTGKLVKRKGELGQKILAARARKAKRTRVHSKTAKKKKPASKKKKAASKKKKAASKKKKATPKKKKGASKKKKAAPKKKKAAAKNRSWALLYLDNENGIINKYSLPVFITAKNLAEAKKKANSKAPKDAVKMEIGSRMYRVNKKKGAPKKKKAASKKKKAAPKKKKAASTTAKKWEVIYFDKENKAVGKPRNILAQNKSEAKKKANARAPKTALKTRTVAVRKAPAKKKTPAKKASPAKKKASPKKASLKKRSSVKGFIGPLQPGRIRPFFGR